MSTKLTSDYVAKFNNRYYIDYDQNNRIEAVHFFVDDSGINMHCVGCTYCWGYDHTYHDNFENSIEDSYCGAYLSMIEDNNHLLKETTKEKFEEIELIVKSQMEKHKKLHEEFNELKDRLRIYV